MMHLPRGNCLSRLGWLLAVPCATKMILRHAPGRKVASQISQTSLNKPIFLPPPHFLDLILTCAEPLTNKRLAAYDHYTLPSFLQQCQLATIPMATYQPTVTSRVAAVMHVVRSIGPARVMVFAI